MGLFIPFIARVNSLFIQKINSLSALNKVGLRLLFKSAKLHFLTHWSSQSHFWSGILGMIVNNSLTLLGVWAMLFAGKSEHNLARDAFFIMNFILAFVWGVIFVFWGGITTMYQMISEGSLDLALMTPRSPFLILSIAKSSLPAWGDLLLGGWGILFFSFKLGWIFFVNCALMSLFSILSFYALFILMGSLAFWLRRTETINSVLLNICIAFIGYPLFELGSSFRWTLYLVPLFLVAVIPAHYVLNPSLQVLFIEFIGSLGLFGFAKLTFSHGLKKYQSSSALGLKI